MASFFKKANIIKPSYSVCLFKLDLTKVFVIVSSSSSSSPLLSLMSVMSFEQKGEALYFIAPIFYVSQVFTKKGKGN